MTPSKRDARRARSSRAGRVYAAQRQAKDDERDPEAARLSRARARRRRTITSRALFAAGAAVAVQHLGLHLTGSPPVVADVLAGYPTAGVLIVAGAFALGA